MLFRSPFLNASEHDHPLSSLGPVVQANVYRNYHKYIDASHAISKFESDMQGLKRRLDESGCVSFFPCFLCSCCSHPYAPPWGLWESGALTMLNSYSLHRSRTIPLRTNPVLRRVSATLSFLSLLSSAKRGLYKTVREMMATGAAPGVRCSVLFGRELRRGGSCNRGRPPETVCVQNLAQGYPRGYVR